jgi:hypothetical protein
MSQGKQFTIPWNQNITIDRQPYHAANLRPYFEIEEE